MSAFNMNMLKMKKLEEILGTKKIKNITLKEAAL